MGSLSKPFFSLSLLFILFTAGILLIPSLSGNARAQQCSIGICKQAGGAGLDVSFPFTTDEGGLIGNFDLLDSESSGACRLFAFDSSADLEITENPIPGWQLVDIVCDEEPGILVTLIDGGVDLDCQGNGVIGRCTFINVPSHADIPTLSEWGMIAAAAGLGLIGVFFVLKKRAVRA